MAACQMTDNTAGEDSVSRSLNSLYWIKNVPDNPFSDLHPRNHLGIDRLIYLMGVNGLKFFRSESEGYIQGRQGLIAATDVVLIKVNAQWKYRGCTNSDLITGLIQQILNHPEGFRGEVVIIENGQGRGSLNCDTEKAYNNKDVHANAIDEQHSFLYLVDTLFNDPRVSAYRLDPIRHDFLDKDDHINQGYRKFENVSYPCFTTAAGNRVELKEGIWQGSRCSQNLKLINVPVLKHHDVGGSEITAALKHLYGLLTMGDGQVRYRHYQGLGHTCGKMMVSVRTPVLNIIDAIWVSQSSLRGFPAETTTKVNQILAGQDPVALDYWAAKYILYPIDNNERHHPDFENIDKWIKGAASIINDRGGLNTFSEEIGFQKVTKDESKMTVYTHEI
jgi:uncharacterized protein (DUF362 family)